MKRDDLRPYLEREIEVWSAKSYEALRRELKEKNLARCEMGAPYHLEVDLLEDKPDYLHVSVAVCSENAKWSCYYPLSSSFIVHRDGRVEKPVLHAGAKA